MLVLRDLTDLEKIKEMDIVGPDGTIRGIKNRVRAGLATYENHGALVKVSKLYRARSSLLQKRGRGWSSCNMQALFIVDNVSPFILHRKIQKKEK